MPTAKSYQNLQIVREVYTANNRKYVDVRTNDGTIKTVRWYSNDEYAKYYGEPAPHQDPYYKPQRTILGFDAGFIWIFNGNTYPHKDWFKSIGATFRRHWGWGLPGDMTLPDELPEGIEAVKLPWDAVKMDDENLLKSDEAIAAAVEKVLYANVNSGEYLGAVGDKITATVTILSVRENDTYFGMKKIYNMEDENGNILVWFSSSKTISWSEGQVVKMTGTIKELTEYHGVKQTVLTRCRESK